MLFSGRVDRLMRFCVTAGVAAPPSTTTRAMSVVPAPSHAASPSLAGGLAGADDSVGAVSLLDASDPMASANQEVLEEAGSDYVTAH